MQTIEIMRQLFAYNEWANRQVIRSLKEHSTHNPKALRALTHLLTSEKQWLLRLKENKDTTGYNFWPELSLDECEALADENSRDYVALLETLAEDDLDSVATYKNSKGITYNTSFRDILMHVVFHATYHRGQVAMAVRAEGGTPAYTDYVAFVRGSEAASKAK